MMTQSRKLSTPSGDIHFPAYIPVTTFGTKYPLDGLIRPYLPRLAKAIMVSWHYAKQMGEKPRLPMMVDSGGFAALFEGSEVVEEGGVGVLYVQREGTTEKDRNHPRDVLDFQEKTADVAFTLDFPIPPGLSEDESKKRHRLTIQNAHWALENRRRKEMPLYACLQAWDRNSALDAANSFKGASFDGIAIGGLVPRAKDRKLIEEIVKAVREIITDKPIHVFGLGKPETTNWLFGLGIDSVDSSSYVKMAADGKLWSDPTMRLVEPSTSDRLHLALCNLATATKMAMPLAVSQLAFSTPALRAR